MPRYGYYDETYHPGYTFPSETFSGWEPETYEDYALYASILIIVLWMLYAYFG